jgi:hypothetical protein
MQHEHSIYSFPPEYSSLQVYSDLWGSSVSNITNTIYNNTINFDPNSAHQYNSLLEQFSAALHMTQTLLFYLNKSCPGYVYTYLQQLSHSHLTQTCSCYDPQISTISQSPAIRTTMGDGFDAIQPCFWSQLTYRLTPFRFDRHYHHQYLLHRLSNPADPVADPLAMGGYMKPSFKPWVFTPQLIPLKLSFNNLYATIQQLYNEYSDIRGEFLNTRCGDELLNHGTKSNNHYQNQDPNSFTFPSHLSQLSSLSAVLFSFNIQEAWRDCVFDELSFHLSQQIGGKCEKNQDSIEQNLENFQITQKVLHQMDVVLPQLTLIDDESNKTHRTPNKSTNKKVKIATMINQQNLFLIGRVQLAPVKSKPIKQEEESNNNDFHPNPHSMDNINFNQNQQNQQQNQQKNQELSQERIDISYLYPSFEFILQDFSFYDSSTMTILADPFTMDHNVDNSRQTTSKHQQINIRNRTDGLGDEIEAVLNQNKNQNPSLEVPKSFSIPLIINNPLRFAPKNQQSATSNSLNNTNSKEFFGHFEANNDP